MGDEVATPIEQPLLHRGPVGQFLEAQGDRQLLRQPFHLIDEQAALLFQVGRTLQVGIAEGQFAE
ncbi:hypothetical protein D3C85_1650030 [compost metagenome]